MTMTSFTMSRKHVVNYLISLTKPDLLHTKNQQRITCSWSLFLLLYIRQHYQRHYTLIRVRFRVPKQGNGIYLNLARGKSPAGSPLNLQLITAGCQYCASDAVETTDLLWRQKLPPTHTHTHEDPMFYERILRGRPSLKGLAPWKFTTRRRSWGKVMFSQVCPLFRGYPWSHVHSGGGYT